MCHVQIVAWKLLKGFDKEAQAGITFLQIGDADFVIHALMQDFSPASGFHDEDLFPNFVSLCDLNTAVFFDLGSPFNAPGTDTPAG